MVELTKYNEQKFLLNCDLIETIEETPDTVITLVNGKKIIVKENRVGILRINNVDYISLTDLAKYQNSSDP